MALNDNFLTILFDPQLATTAPVQSGPGSNDNEGAPYTL